MVPLNELLARHGICIPSPVRQMACTDVCGQEQQSLSEIWQMGRIGLHRIRHYFFWAVCLVIFTAKKNCGHCWVLVCHAVLCHWLPQPTKTASKSVSSTPQLEQTLQPGFCWSFGFCWAFIDPGHRQKYPHFHVLPRIPLWKGSQSCWSKGCLLLDSIPLSSNSHKLGFS